jgi:hypothetical protein
MPPVPAAIAAAFTCCVTDMKRGVAGAQERVVAHSAKRAQYRAANP